MTSKINRSWEKQRIEVHSPKGVRELRKEIKYGLTKKYFGIAQSIWRYDGLDNPLFADMRVMSADTVPEIYLLRNGMCTWFYDAAAEQIHCLPLTYDGGINIYGRMSRWHPVPVGYTDDRKGTYSPEVERIRNMDLDYDNSVIMKNDLFGGNDEGYISKMIDELVDNTLTMNQLQLIAKCPFVFKVNDNTLLSAQNFFLAVCEDKPAIFKQDTGEDPAPVIESTQMKIDPALFELFDRFECQILEYIGLPCVPITKRAQQTVSEVQSNDDKIKIRRLEKWNQREAACRRINEMWGTDMHCVSVIDEHIEEQEAKEAKDDARNIQRG